MVKCTRSTEASDFSRLRQVRSPACGSPETSSTRSLSRTPSIATTARLLMVVELALERRGVDLDDVLPGMRDLHLHAHLFARDHVAGFQQLAVAADGELRRAGPRRPGPRRAARWSAAARRCRSAAPMTSWMRRSRSPGRPVISACTGAVKPSCAASAGTSCTRPSVMMTAPATRSGGTSASAAPSAANSRVPSVSPSAWPASTTRTSRSAMRLEPLRHGGARGLGLLSRGRRSSGSGSCRPPRRRRRAAPRGPRA